MISDIVGSCSTGRPFHWVKVVDEKSAGRLWSSSGDVEGSKRGTARENCSWLVPRRRILESSSSRLTTVVIVVIVRVVVSGESLVIKMIKEYISQARSDLRGKNQVRSGTLKDPGECVCFVGNGDR